MSDEQTTNDERTVNEERALTEALTVIDGGASAPNAVLKSITITGFKSMLPKTTLEFAPGITAIIGPNGSGKSNVADAIRWALGENNARILRAKRNDELIFAGSETRPGTGMAEVTLQLDNSSRRLPVDFTELEVGRRLFKSGEAEYLVNRSKVRLRDLQDLLAGANLADNPFVVIGQGLVDQVLALRPSDRRTVIEEAAGTRRLHLRREDALNRLKSAEVELVRVIDILREIGPRVALLEDQAGKWTEYEVLRNELRRRALRWYRSSFGETANARTDLVAKLQSVEREIERLADYVTESEGITAGTDDELRLAREEEERRRLGAADAVAAESGLRERIAALQAATEAAVAERDRTRSVLATLPAEAAGLRQRRTTVDEEAAAAARQAREAADRARSAEEDASRTRVALAEAQAARVEAERARLMRESEESRLTEDERALLERDEELAAAAATLAGQRAERERERERVALELSRARDAANELDSEVEALAAGAGSARNDLQRVEGDLALLRGQTAALEEATSRAVAELAAREGGTAAEPLPPGLAWLHDRLNIPPQLRDAVAQALGDAVALAPGDSLVEQPARRDLTLLVPSVTEDEPAPEGTRRLADLLTLDDDVRRVAGALLRNVFIAKDMRAPFTAARTMQRGIVVGPGVVATPGVLRLVAREDAARDAVRQLRGMSG
ncbi:MAG: AAA family ATPase, partial [Chloroflexota bacterium]|nr:AAA family ATPase [Chloroflexota bacterium]